LRVSLGEEFTLKEKAFCIPWEMDAAQFAAPENDYSHPADNHSYSQITPMPYYAGKSAKDRC